MSKQSSQRGASFLELLLVVAVVGVIVFIGVKVFGVRAKLASTNSTSTAQVQVPAKLTSKADLQKASAALDATSFNSGDLSQLNTDLNSLL